MGGGQPCATPVVLIHGLPGTAADWEDVTPLLADHRTIAIDRPGTISLGLAERYPSEVSGLVLVDAAAAGEKTGTFQDTQAHAVTFLQTPVIRQIAKSQVTKAS